LDDLMASYTNAGAPELRESDVWRFAGGLRSAGVVPRISAEATDRTPQ